jgi:outer membrane biosynthesis protein TonB
MAQATGTVEVAFSVDAAGIAAVKGATGPDIFKRAAEQAVASWTFRRTRADRIFLVAEFKYGLDTASAAVRPDVK